MPSDPGASPYMGEQDEATQEPVKTLPEADDRRHSERHALSLNSAWTVLCDDGTGAPRTRVRDISQTGIALLVDEPLRPGTVLVITLQNQLLRLTRLLPIRVMHATHGDDGWVLGCQFVRKLSAPEIQTLLGGAGEPIEG